MQYFIMKFERGEMSESDLYLHLGNYPEEYLQMNLRHDYMESYNRWRRGINIQL